VCCTCGLPNYSTSLFEQCSFDTSNSFSSLSDSYNFSAELKSPTDLGPPLHSSSPKQLVDKNINELKVLTINFQSICNKREIFENLINSSDPDIIIGTETWLKPNILNSELLPKSHHIVARKDRKDGHGGVIIATKVTLPCNEIEINDHDTELVAVKVSCIGNQSLIVTSAYRPTNEDADYAVNMCNAFTDIVMSNKNATIWISGDINLPDINWKDMSVEGRSYSKQLNQTFLNTINDGIRPNRRLPNKRAKYTRHILHQPTFVDQSMQTCTRDM